MALLRRGKASGPQAVYARMLDGEHLWLAVRTEEPGLLLHPGNGDDLALPTRTEGDLLTARFPLAQELEARDEAVETTLDVRAGTAQKSEPVRWDGEPPRPGTAPMLLTPATRDRRWQFEIQSHRGRLRVVRRALDPAVWVASVRSDDGGVTLRLQLPGAARASVGPNASPTLDVMVDQLVAAALACTTEGDDLVVRLSSIDLAPGAVAPLSIGGLPVVRTHHQLRHPQPSVVLPTVAGDVELRWLREGQLAIARNQPREAQDS